MAIVGVKGLNISRLE